LRQSFCPNVSGRRRGISLSQEQPHEQPTKNQNYEPHKERISHEIKLSSITLRPGEFIHIFANGKSVEVLLDDDGVIGVCVSEGVAVNTFEENYGVP